MIKKDFAFIANLHQPYLCAFVLLFRDFTIFVKYWDLENVSPTELLTFFANNDNNAISFNERKDDFSSTICEKCSNFLKKKKKKEILSIHLWHFVSQDRFLKVKNLKG